MVGGRSRSAGGLLCLLHLLDLAGLDAGGAHEEALGRTVHDGADALDVGVPTTLGAPVGVADRHAERRLLAADLAHRCHVVVPRTFALLRGRMSIPAGRWGPQSPKFS